MKNFRGYIESSLQNTLEKNIQTLHGIDRQNWQTWPTTSRIYVMVHAPGYWDNSPPFQVCLPVDKPSNVYAVGSRNISAD
jgi:hypothetical protein